MRSHWVRSRQCGLSIVAALLVAQSTFAREPGGLPTGRASELGFNEAKLAAIPEALKKAVDAKQVSGAVTLVAKDGKIVQVDAVGLADIDGKRPMTQDSLFAIASMTKPITATAVLILQDEGKLSVDDPASKYIPQFKGKLLADGTAAREITIRDLMTHTSGVTRPAGQTGAAASRTLKETAEAIAAAPLAFAPGSKWQYGDGLTVCGRIIEIAGGMPYDEFVKARITGPLGMSDTTFHPSAEQLKRRALNYKPGKEAGTIEPASELNLSAEALANRTPGPSGGLFSTAGDMARFYQMILNGGELEGKRIVSKKAVEQMTTIQTGDIVTGFTPGNGWGLGWCVVREPQGVTKAVSPGTFGHGGAWGTQGWVDPKRGMIFVLMIQRSNFGNSDGSDLRGAFQQAAVDALK